MPAKKRKVEKREEDKHESEAQSSRCSKPAKQAKQDGQKAVSKDLKIPVDEGFAAANASVYIDGDGIIYDASLNQTNIENNANKFYRLQLLQAGDAYYTHTRWGRVGERGQVKSMGPDPFPVALKEFGKKFKDKSGHTWQDRGQEPKKGKYTFIERNYESDDEEGHVAAAEQDIDGEDDGQVEENREKRKAKSPSAPSTLPPQLQSLMRLIFNENHFKDVLEDIGYNANRLPLGKLSKKTIKTGFEYLQELASLLNDPSLAQSKHGCSYRQALEDFSNKYYSCIPHIFGWNRARLIDTNDMVEREVKMLDTLTDMEIADKIMRSTTERNKDVQRINELDQQFKNLKMDEVTPLDVNSDEFKNVKEYLINTTGKTHHIQYTVQDIFRIARAGEHRRFLESKFAHVKDSNRHLLWHGSRTTNYGGILSQGLRIAPPEAPVNGYAFGKGVYLADISTKSANYCMTYQSAGEGLLLLCEAELGKPMYELLVSDPDAGVFAEKAGCIATKGMGRTVPQGWMDAGCIHESLKGVLMPDTSKEPADQSEHPSAFLQYNEYICYDVAQIRLRYLLRVRM